MNTFINKLKKRWQVESIWQVLLILFIFSITGMTSLYVRSFIFEFIGVIPQTPVWIKIVLWILVEIPAYQLLFLAYGFLLGQFEFVWRFEKNTFRQVKKIFIS